MKVESLFQFTSYKKLMKAFLVGDENRGQLTRAAEALNCQRSYLSRVISEELQLTPDHAFGLANFWKLSNEERDYFLLLVDFERGATPDYRAHVKSRIDEARKKYQSVQERAQRSGHTVEKVDAQYFSSWIWSALHFLTSIPQYQTIDALSDRLGLSEKALAFHLQELKSRGLVSESKGRWTYQSGDFHVPKDSPLVVFHHQNWRQRACTDAQNFAAGSVHYTGVHTVSVEDAEKIKEMILNFIADLNRVASPSSPEDGVVVTCDFFKI